MIIKNFNANTNASFLLKVEFDLFLEGQMPRDAQRSKIWEVVGTVPVQENVRKDGSLLKQNRTSRSAARAINEDDYADEVDARQTKGHIRLQL